MTRSRNTIWPLGLIIFLCAGIVGAAMSATPQSQFAEGKVPGQNSISLYESAQVIEGIAQVGGQLIAGEDPEGAVISVLDQDWNLIESISPDTQGSYTVSLLAGSYWLIAAKDGYASSDPTFLSVESGATYTVDFSLSRKPQPDTVLYFGDFEHAKDWPEMSLSQDYVKNGKYSGVWRRMDRKPKSHCYATPTDWTGYTQLEFWAYLEQPSTSPDAGLMMVIDSDDPATDSWDYYYYKLKLDWQGWKHFVFQLDDLKVNNSPLGFDQIQHFFFSAKDWGHVPDSEVVMYIDGMRLATAAIGGVVLAPDSTPVLGATVTIEGPLGEIVEVSTDEAGAFRYRGLESSTVPATYYVSAKMDSLLSGKQEVVIESGTNSVLELKLIEPGQGIVSGLITAGENLENAVVSVLDQDWNLIESILPDTQGFYSVSLPAGSYWLVAAKDGYISSDPTFLSVEAAATHTVDFSLSRNPQPDTVLYFGDFEHAKDWPEMSLSQDYVKNGKYSGVWRRMDRKPKSHCYATPTDWTGYTQLEFWAYLEQPSTSPDAGLMMVIDSDDPATDSWDYFYSKFKLDWQGWKHFVIPLSQLAINNSPLGFDQIQHFFFSAKDWGHVPDSEVVLYIDGMRLATAAIGGVVLSPDNTPVLDATVTIEGPSGEVFEVSTDSDGTFRYRGLGSSTAPATYYVSAKTDSLLSGKQEVVIESGTNSVLELKLIEPGQGIVSGQVTLGENLEDAVISVLDQDWNLIDSISPDTQGFYSVSLPTGSYWLVAAKDGYTSSDPSFLSVESGAAYTVDFSLSRNPQPDTVFYFGDFEHAKDWTSMDLSQDYVKSGKYSGVWKGMDQKREAHLYSIIGDWTGFTQLEFWAYLEQPSANSDAGLMMIIDSDNPATESWDYYYYKMKLDWQGWKHFVIPLNELATNGVPLGLDQIKRLYFTAKGWGFVPDPNVVLYLDGMRLATAAIGGVVLAPDSTPAPDVTVTIEGPSGEVFEVSTDRDGVFRYRGLESSLDAVTYFVTAITETSQSEKQEVLIQSGDNVELELKLKEPEKGVVSGQITAGEDAVVSVLDQDWNLIDSILADPQGSYTVSLPAGSYLLVAAKDGYISSDPTFLSVEAAATYTMDFSLNENPQPDTILYFADFEHVKDWPVLGLSQDYVKSGKYSGVWTQMDQKPKAYCDNTPTDWTGFTQLEFWAYLEQPSANSDAGLMMIIDSDNPATGSWDYYYYKMKLDWQGWKHFVFQLDDLKVNNSPLGFDQVQSLLFSAKGWGLVPDPSVVLYLDGMRLATAAIGGVVLAPDSNPASGATVTIEKPSGEVFEVSTDQDGAFSYRGLETGILSFAPLLSRE